MALITLISTSELTLVFLMTRTLDLNFFMPRLTCPATQCKRTVMSRLRCLATQCKRTVMPRLRCLATQHKGTVMPRLILIEI